MSTPTKIYFSHSFHEQDRLFVKAIRDAFEALKKAHRFELIDSAHATSEQLYERVIRPMRDANIVVCIFTRRQEITGSSPTAYAAPPYVVAEAAAALAQEKRLLAFVEEGVSREELGLVSAWNPQLIYVNRQRAGSVDYDRELRDLIAENLKHLVTQIHPPYTFLSYEMMISLYPNAYTLMSQRLDVHLRRTEPIQHAFLLHARGGSRAKLPSASELLQIGRQHPCPFPTVPFAAFSSETVGARIAPVTRKAPGSVREYKVHLGDPGRHQYEWMCGTPHGFDPKRHTEWTHLAISQRAIERLRVVMRVHRGLARKAKPHWAQVTGGLFDSGDSEDAYLKRVHDRQEMAPARENPFFHCYELTLDQITRGVDLLLLY